MPETSRRSTLLAQPANRPDRTPMSADGSLGWRHNLSHRSHTCRVDPVPAVLEPYSRWVALVVVERESEDSDEWREAPRAAAWPSSSIRQRPNRRLVRRSGCNPSATSTLSRRSQCAEDATPVLSVCLKSQTLGGRGLRRERLHRLYHHRPSGPPEDQRPA